MNPYFLAYYITFAAWVDRTKATLKRLFSYYSTYVAFIASSVAAFWLQQDVATQQAVLASFPSLKFIGPGLAFGAFMVTRNWPQKPKD